MKKINRMQLRKMINEVFDYGANSGMVGPLSWSISTERMNSPSERLMQVTVKHPSGLFHTTEKMTVFTSGLEQIKSELSGMDFIAAARRLSSFLGYEGDGMKMRQMLLNAIESAEEASRGRGNTFRGY
jgi:hypothetical protein